MITIPDLRWRAVCRLDDLEAGWGEAALLTDDRGATVQLALFRLDDDTVHVTSNLDPATGAPVMSRGIVGSRGDAPTVASPLHKQVYDLRTGAGLSDAGLSLPTYPARLTEGTVEIGLS